MRGQATHCSESELLQHLWLGLFCFTFKYLYSHWERAHRQWGVSARTDSLFKGKKREWLSAGFVVYLSCLKQKTKKEEGNETRRRHRSLGYIVTQRALWKVSVSICCVYISIYIWTLQFSLPHIGECSIFLDIIKKRISNSISYLAPQK